MKKLFLTIVFLLMGFINFGYCGDYIGNQIVVNTWNLGPNQSATFGSVRGDIVCFQSSVSYCNSISITAGDYSVTGNPYNQSVCLYGFGQDIKPSFINNTNSYCDFYLFRGSSSFISDPMTSLQCQTEYNLIPISSVDQNYCVNNGLCPSSECPDIPGSGDNWSALYINDIQHLGKPIINITFPDYLDWDYTTNENEFNLDIEGYNVDTDYISGIITIQNSKPTNEDLNNIITNVIPLFVPGLVIILFIYFIFRFLKKVF